MFYTETEVMEFVKENDVKFIRLAFCDIFGVQKNIAIMPSELQRAFQEGFPFDATAVPGLESADDDLLLVPDPSTFSILPWRPDTGRVIRLSCNLFNRDMTPFELDSRYLLKQATAAARKAGVTCNMGVNCEFYLFRTDENGNPTETPLDNAGYFDIAPEDKGENIRREICLSLESMGICPESSHHEEGPGQNEIDFKYSDPLSSADNVTAFKVAVTTLAARNGLYASFAPKPIPDKNGNGFHINISPDMFQPEEGYFEHFMAGIMNRINEITLFLNPGKDSYQRLGGPKAPKYISWSKDNRSHLMRVPSTNKKPSIELRSPDPRTNPYIAYALIIRAGLEGIEKKLTLPAPCTVSVDALPETDRKQLKPLPRTLAEAAEIAENSEFIRRILPQSMIQAYKRDYR